MTKLIYVVTTFESVRFVTGFKLDTKSEAFAAFERKDPTLLKYLQAKSLTAMIEEIKHNSHIEFLTEGEYKGIYENTGTEILEEE